MTTNPRRRLMLFALLGLAACGAGEPTRFYLLSPEPPVAAPERGGPIVFVDQATIAPYLDRAQIVSRVAPTRSRSPTRAPGPSR